MANDLKRRDFIAASGAAALLAGAPLAAAAANSGPSKLSDIDHFVILMQENRSFDHYFGSLRGVRGFDDRSRTLPDGGSIFRQPDRLNPDGFALPFRLDTTRTSAQQLSDLSHEWHVQHNALNGGAMDRWLAAHRASNGAKGPLTMGYYTREDLPFNYALADAFTICDGYHCSVLGPTYPNRLYHWSATIDPAGTRGGPVINNNAYGKQNLYKWDTYPEALERAGVSWQIAYEDDDYAMNVLRYFSAYTSGPKAKTLTQKALTGRPMASILGDMRSGNLPSVTWLVTKKIESEHPAYLPAVGANYLHSVLQALWSNPGVWARTAVIVNYDENDGQFDHVAPRTPPPGTQDEFIDGLPIGLGFRVPALIISPFSRGGHVNSETFDHTSTLRLLEARYGVEVPNLSAWRRATCGDLQSAFGFGEPARIDVPQLPDTEALLRTAQERIASLPKPSVPLVQSMPTQEPGTRPRRGPTPPLSS